ncbi:NAD(P)/FAD-dependent oxidoreductase [Gilvimarinus sp. F26214L]|uniref:NAD(P)/FAD-dependent oxidoreductase n=1 Tax=Gilvimarinus sp. DZF01 TaxID=3461371 RepID=UPI004045DBF2
MLESLVIGGGPGGAAAAIQLARQGRPVRLLERSRGLHHKVCGEFISWEAAAYLAELGVDLQALGALPIQRLHLISAGDELEVPLPFPAWSLSRKVLDGALLEQAEYAGAQVDRGCAARDLDRRNGEWRVRTGAGELRAGSVFLATGKHELRNWRRAPDRETDLIGLKMHMRLSRQQTMKLRGAVELYVFAQGYGGLELVEDEVANFCVLVSKRLYQSCTLKWPVLLEHLRGNCPRLRARLMDAESLWPRPLAVAGVPYGYQAQGPAPDGLFRIGDQAAVIPSFAGDGIAMALHSAFLAAKVHCSDGGASAYQREAHRHFRGPVRNARLFSALLAAHSSRRAMFLLGRWWPSLARSAARRMRMSAYNLQVQPPLNFERR